MKFTDDFICFYGSSWEGLEVGLMGSFSQQKCPSLCTHWLFLWIFHVPQLWEQLWRSPISWECPLMLVPVQNHTLIYKFSPQTLKLSPGSSEEFNSGNSFFCGTF